ncbi:MAG: holo-ACP synthase [Acidimicrobiales bacterium]
MIGIGTDLVELDRFRTVLARTPSIAERIFSDEERAYADRRSDPTERLAVRFAAKEAVMKAMGVGLGAFPLRDVEVVRTDAGQPTVTLRGRAAELATERGVRTWHLTLAHTENLAHAIAVAL